MKNRSIFRDYQHYIVDRIRNDRRVGIFAGMGLGKTVSSFTAISDLQNEFACGKALIVAPLRVAQTTWPNEFSEWEHLKDTRYSIITGARDTRIAALRKPADVYIINRENLVWLEKFLLALAFCKKWRPRGKGEVRKSVLGWLEDTFLSKSDMVDLFKFNSDVGTYTINDVNVFFVKLLASQYDDILKNFKIEVFIIDESSSFKNKGAKRWKSLARMSKESNYVILLTGTPAPNAYTELFSQIYLLDKGKRLGTSFVEFCGEHFNQGYNGYSLEIKPGHDKIIQNEISDICVSLREEDYLKLPKRIDSFMYVKMSDAERKKYKKFEREFIYKTLNGKTIEAINAAALTQKLLQLANGAIYDEDRKWHFVHDAKIEALKEIVEELDGEPLLITYYFQSDLERLQKAFPTAEKIGKRNDQIARWNKGQIPLFLVHPKSAGHGLNLQHGGCNTVWFGLIHSLEEYLQLNKRLHRSGQTRPVSIRHILTENTIDDHVLKVLQQRDANQNELLRVLRHYVEENDT